MGTLLERAEKFRDEVLEKSEHHQAKFRRAKKAENSNTHYDRYRMYYELYMRAAMLVRRLIDSKQLISYEFDRAWALGQYKTRLKQKEKRKQDFLNKHVASIWFFQARLSADYGEFTCDRCHRTFYHSPSTIKKAAKEIIHCCCGSCTNEIISKDWGKAPYQ